MKLSIKQAREIKNLVALIFCDVSPSIHQNDKHAWQAADIPNRENLNVLIGVIRKGVSND